MPIFGFTSGFASAGYGLFLSDGTLGGTRLVAPYVRAYDTVGFRALGDGRVLFEGKDDLTGLTLWVTDGTAAGTLPILSATSGFGWESPTPVGAGKWLLTANAVVGGQSTGHELWVTDGSEAGTYLLRDIHPYVTPSGFGSSSYPYGFAPLGDGRVLFSANDGANGRELWITDGTCAGTRLVKDLRFPTSGGDPAFFSSYPGLITPLGDGRAVFFASDNTGLSLFVTDGSEAGTGPLRGGLTAYAARPLGGGRVLFVASNSDLPYFGRELWVTDGTVAGTGLVRDIVPGGSSSYIRYITPLGDGRALFTAVTGSTGRELWVTDGTMAGTNLVRDIAPGAHSYPRYIKPLGDGRALFTATTASAGRELWVTDGTTAGTSLLRNIGPGAANGYVGNITPLGGGRALFTARYPTVGDELWVTDGTSAGTSLVRDINPGSANSHPHRLTPLPGGKALFMAFNGAGYELWVTDGSTAGTRALGVSPNFDLMAAFLNLAPSLAAALPDAEGAEGEALFVPLPPGSFTDPDVPGLDSLTYSATLTSGAPLPGWLSMNPVTGALSGTPPFDLAAPGAPGTLGLRITATDSFGKSVSDDITLTIFHRNRPPVVANPLADREGQEGAPLSFTLPDDAFADPDAAEGDTLGFAARLADGSPLPDWLAFDPVTRTFTGTPPFDAAGSLNIRVTATDTTGASVSDDFLLAVANTNRPPTLAIPLPNTKVTEGSAFTYTVPPGTFADPDLPFGDSLTLSARQANGAALPAWLNFDPATGQFTGTPPLDAPAALLIRVSATDASGASVFDDFRMDIRNLIQGTAGNDILTGLDGRENLILALGGNDVVTGGNRPDEIRGSAGNDTVHGGGGNDLLYGDNGNDSLHGDAGNDTLYGGRGDDVLEGGEGNDLLNGGEDNDLLLGGAGNDKLYGGAGDDTLVGGAGVDILDGGDGADLFRFLSVADSPFSARDRIQGFNFAQGDRIDLSAIDADGNPLNGDTAFTWIGTAAFTGVAQLRAVAHGAGFWRVEANTGGSLAPDFGILVQSSTAPVSDWFLL